MKTVIVVWCVIALVGCDTGTVVQDAPQRLYVANQEDASVSVLDMRTNRLLETVDLREYGFGDNARPHHVAVEPDGSFWYVSLIGANALVKFSEANELVGRVDGIETPGMVVLHPTRDLLVAARSMSAPNPPASMVLVERSSMTLLAEPAVVFPRPHALSVSGDQVFTASLSASQFITADVTDTDDVVVTPIPMDAAPFAHFTTTAQSGIVYATNDVTNQVHALDVSQAPSVSVVASVDVEPGPWHPVVTPDGAFVYVGNKQANAVTVIDAGTYTTLDTLRDTRLVRPHGSAVSPDGRYVYISGNGPEGGQGMVAVIRASDRTVESVVEVGRGAAGMGAQAR